MKLLLPPAVALAYGEPWRLGRNGALVSDQPDGRTGVSDRAFYGGNLVAESITRDRAARAADCVNFCAGAQFAPGAAYVGGLVDLVDALEALFRTLPEPVYPCDTEEQHEQNRRWRDTADLLRAMGREPFARARAPEAA